MDNITIVIKRNSDGATFGIGKGYSWKLLKKGLDGFGEFANDITYVDNGIYDGGLITSTRMGDVDRTIKCGYIRLNENVAMRRKVTEFFNIKDTFKVYITYMERTLWAEGKLYKFDFSMEDAQDAMMELTLTFFFPNPYLNSYDDFGKNIASVIPMIGFPYMVSANTSPKGLTGGVYAFSRSVTINNDGDVDTYCRVVFKADGEVVNPKLSIGEEYVRVIDTMEQGDELEMDFTVFPPTVKKNGVNCIGKCDRKSSFTGMNIVKGDVVVGYDADDGESNLAVSFYYNKLYTAI